MKIAFLILIFIHGLIHILGFLKSFGLKKVKELTLPISKAMGLLWLTATVLFLLYGILVLVNYKYAWIVGLITVVFSQILIIIFWRDAKFGTIPNIVILIVVIISYGNYNYNQPTILETGEILNQCEISIDSVISENDLAELY